MEMNGLLWMIGTAVIFSVIGILYTRGKRFSVEDFISARSSLGLGTLAATLVATSMGAWILFSPAETSVVAGIVALIGYGLASACALFVFCVVGVRLRNLMPKGHSLTEFVYHRFGKLMYAMVLLITCFYMAVYLAAELTGIALAAQMVFGIPLFTTSLIVGISVLAYTSLGGFKASVFTDKVQSWFIVPLLALIFVGSLFFLGGFDQVLSTVPAELLSLSHVPGIEYALTLIIAIIGAELFNQTSWQRVYAAKSSRVVKQSFFIAGLVVIPIIVLAGLFGLLALGTGAADEPSVAMFTFLLNVTPPWVLITAMVLGIILVMSSMDSLLNGFVSLFTVDLVRLRPSLKQESLHKAGKWFTVVVAAIAVLVSMKGLSVLYLFLLADLVCVAALFPVFYGMYAKKFSGSSAFISTIAGIIAGFLYFPDTTWSTSILGLIAPLPFMQANLLWSFAIAFVVPLVLSFALRFGKPYSFAALKKKVVVLSDE